MKAMITETSAMAAKVCRYRHGVKCFINRHACLKCSILNGNFTSIEYEKTNCADKPVMAIKSVTIRCLGTNAILPVPHYLRHCTRTVSHAGLEKPDQAQKGQGIRR